MDDKEFEVRQTIKAHVLRTRGSWELPDAVKLERFVYELNADRRQRILFLTVLLIVGVIIILKLT